MEKKDAETIMSLNTWIDKSDEIMNFYTEEVRRMQQNARYNMKMISLEHKRILLHLNEQKRKLEQRRKTLLKQTEKLDKMPIEVEKELDSKQAMQQEIKPLKEFMMESLRKDFKGKEDLDSLEGIKINQSNSKLIIEKCQNVVLSMLDKKKLNDSQENYHDLLIDDKKELRAGVVDMPCCGNIGTKRMVEVDVNTFIAPFNKCSDDEFDVEAAKQCASWKQQVTNDLSRQPVKCVKDEDIRDTKDEKSMKLRNDEFGDEVGKNPSDVLWNFDQEREATIEEGLHHIAKLLDILKQRIMF